MSLGGIAIWPPSQYVMQSFGLLREIEKIGAYMPEPSYRNQDNAILAEPSNEFSRKFPVLCFQRDSLCEILMKECNDLAIPILTNTHVTGFELVGHKVAISVWQLVISLKSDHTIFF